MSSLYRQHIHMLVPKGVDIDQEGSFSVFSSPTSFARHLTIHADSQRNLCTKCGSSARLNSLEKSLPLKSFARKIGRIHPCVLYTMCACYLLVPTYVWWNRLTQKVVTAPLSVDSDNHIAINTTHTNWGYNQLSDKFMSLYRVTGPQPWNTGIYLPYSSLFPSLLLLNRIKPSSQSMYIYKWLAFPVQSYYQKLKFSPKTVYTRKTELAKSYMVILLVFS